MFKYADGLLIYNLLKIFKNGETYTFPVSFVDELYSATATYNNATSNNNVFWVGIGAKTKSSIRIFISNGYDTTTGIIAIGRWK